MRGAAKAFLVSSRSQGNNGGNNRTNNYGGGEGGGPQNNYQMGGMPFFPPRYPPYGNEPDDMMRGEVDNRFRDRRGREHYNNGRFAPMRNEMRNEMGGNEPEEMRGGMPDEMGAEMRGRYRNEMRRGNRNEMRGGYDMRMDGNESGSEPVENRRGYRNDGREGGGGVRSGGYDEPNQIGFRADGGFLRMLGGESKSGQMEKGHGSGKSVEPIDQETAEEWTSKMHNADGTRGPHWSMEQTKQVMQQRNINVDPIEFFVAMNMVYSDYSKVAKTHGVNSVDFYADFAKAFLEDKDANPEKLALYYECIVKQK